MADTFALARDNFKVQADHCKNIGSAFYADLLIELADLIVKHSAIGEVFSDWEGDPNHDAVALRFAAALHYLVITVQDAELAKTFPPSLEISGAPRIALLERVIQEHEGLILSYLKLPPQTNEVGRSMAMLGGFLEVAKRFGPDMDVFEVGASAGLNLLFDQYYYSAEGWQWGNSDSEVKFELNWQGKLPTPCDINVHKRLGCDISPVDVVTEQNRLLSYVWPDQLLRLERIRAAISVTQKFSPTIAKMEASSWLKRLNKQSDRERTQVFYHSIIWQYFSPAQKKAFEEEMNLSGAKAKTYAPVVWMRLEPTKGGEHAELRMTVWPGKKEQVLAASGYHGEWVKWSLV